MQTLTQAISAASPMGLGPGRFLLLLETTGPVTITFYRSPKVTQAIDMEAGFMLGPLDEGEGWASAVITSATAQTIKLVIGDVRAEYARTVGVVTVQPGSAFVTGKSAAIAAGAAANVFAANTGRRRASITNPSTHDGSLWLGGVVGQGVELVPGQTWDEAVTSAVSVWNAGTVALEVPYSEVT